MDYQAALMEYQEAFIQYQVANDTKRVWDTRGMIEEMFSDVLEHVGIVLAMWR